MKEIVVITGAAAGIGRALTNQYLHLDHKVAALDVDAKALTQMKKEFKTHGKNLKTFPVDVTKKTAFKEVGLEIKTTLGQPTIWINNAGVAKIGPFEKMTEAEFQKVFDINYKGVVHGTRIALSLMKQPERGKIVNVASVNGKLPAPFMSAYVASKHAVVGFTRSLQLEFHQTQRAIDIILVVPGFVRTSMIKEHQGFELPGWIDSLVSHPNTVAKEMIRGIRRGDLEIQPTMTGRMLLRMNQLAPDLTARSSKLLVAKNWKELLGLDPIEK